MNTMTNNDYMTDNITAPIGTAIPTSPPGNFTSYTVTPAITLRDFIAAQAMSGWLASYAEDQHPVANGVAQFAYEIADAMLAERSKTP